MKICHVTSVHPSTDVRIAVKECPSLAEAGYDTYLVAPGKSREENGVHIVGIGDSPINRIKRILTFSEEAYQKALSLNCVVYHLHDPELLPYGLKLKKRGKIVIFDSHEDIPAQIRDKYWIPKALRQIVSAAYSKYQTYALRHFDAVIAATPYIAERLKSCANKVVIVNNYPKLDDIAFQNKPFFQREKIIGYAGSLDDNRGRKVVVEAMKFIDGKLYLAGNETIEGYENIVNCGVLNREEVNKLYENSRMGIVLYQPAANHYKAQPVKMFEYMAAGLPVVASNFLLWQDIVAKNQCGICVEPTNPAQVSEACNKLLNDPGLAEEMGRNGRKAVETVYNWEKEKQVLLKLYQDLTG